MEDTNPQSHQPKGQWTAQDLQAAYLKVMQTLIFAYIIPFQSLTAFWGFLLLQKNYVEVLHKMWRFHSFPSKLWLKYWFNDILFPPFFPEHYWLRELAGSYQTLSQHTGLNLGLKISELVYSNSVGLTSGKSEFSLDRWHSFYLKI